VVAVKWKLAGASVVGFSHQAAGTVCQDAHAVTITPTGWLVGVVSDGAGSARFSGESSQLLSKEVVAQLTVRLNALEASDTQQIPEEVVRIWIEDAVEAVRRQLPRLRTEIVESNGLQDFHATLLGVVAGLGAGVFFHIGDGAGCATSMNDVTKAIISGPENGEYANETYFVTQDDWRDHLRITSFDPQYDLITLMSDGVTPFALDKGQLAPFPPFFVPLSKFLAEHDREEGERAITTILARDAIRPITGDDKTLVWALRTASEA
jgi:hypothetical protein